MDHGKRQAEVGGQAQVRESPRVRPQAQEELDDQQREEETGRQDERLPVTMRPPDPERQRRDENRQSRRPQERAVEARAEMSEEGPEDDLEVHDAGRQEGQPAERGGIARGNGRGTPRRRREERQATGETEERPGEG